MPSSFCHARSRKPQAAHLVEHESQEASSHLADEPRRGKTHEQYNPEFIQQVAEVLNLEAFDQSDRADILAFMRNRFNSCAPVPGRGGPPPANCGPAGRFTGAAQGGGVFRSAGVAPRLPPRDVKDMLCVNCGMKGHMARDCRQPRQEDKSKRPCLACRKVGHLVRDCPDKPKALKMLENGEFRQPVFLGCVEAVDADGFRRVGRP